MKKKSATVFVHQTFHHMCYILTEGAQPVSSQNTKHFNRLPWAAGSSLVPPAHHLSLKEEETELIYDGAEREKKGKQKNGWGAAGCHPEWYTMSPLK